MARPRAFTQDQITAALQETKGMVTVAARRLGCSANTIRAYAARYPNTVGRTLADERAMMTDVAELALFKAIQSGELTAIIFYLKTQGKDRGYVERHETTGPDGAPIAFTLNLGDAIPTEDMDLPAAETHRLPAQRTLSS